MQSISREIQYFYDLFLFFLSINGVACLCASLIHTPTQPTIEYVLPGKRYLKPGIWLQKCSLDLHVLCESENRSKTLFKSIDKNLHRAPRRASIDENAPAKRSTSSFKRISDVD